MDLWGWKVLLPAKRRTHSRQHRPSDDMRAFHVTQPIVVGEEREGWGKKGREGEEGEERGKESDGKDVSE